jgi:tetratricopeptide (TPR) repeat protein
MIRTISLLGLLVMLSCSISGPSDADLQLFSEAKRAYTSGDWNQSASILSQASWDHFPQAKLLLGRSLFLLDRHSESLPLFQELQEALPSYTEAGVWLARNLVAQSEFDQALEVIQDQLDWSPEDPRLYNLLGSIYESQGELDKALGAWEQVFRQEAELAKANISLSQAYFRFGIGDRAQEYLDRAAAMVDPDSSLHGILTRAQENINLMGQLDAENKEQL